MSKPLSLFSVLLLGMFAFPLPPRPPMETPNGDPSFRGDRRPGILEPATEEPTGENALLYRRVGALRPDELLDLLSEEPNEPKEVSTSF